jgi:hypothetical protein
MKDGYYRCRYKKSTEWEYIGLLKTDPFGEQKLYLPGIEEDPKIEDYIFHHILIPLKISIN